MTIFRRRTLVEIGKCGDLAICCVSLFLATTLHYHPSWQTTGLLLQHPLRRLVLTAVLAFCWHLSLLASGAYRSYRIAGWTRQAAALTRGATIACFWAGVWICLSTRRKPITLRYFLFEIVLFWAFTLTGLFVTRLAARVFTRSFRRRGRNLREVLIVGTNRRAIALADRLLGHADYGFRLAGFVDNFWHFNDAPEEYKKKLLGDSDNLLDLLRNLAIDEVIIALPIASSYHLTNQIIDWCRMQGIPVRSEGSFFDVNRQALPGSDAPLQLITHHEVVHGEWSIFCKRLIDLVVSAAALIALLPALLAIALAIRLDSPGKILFEQERLGTNKRRFTIYKFRTMVVNAEAMMDTVAHLNQSGGPTYKSENDPRITKVGSFLRKTSLDELPQLFNVFRGDMSLVGPRPLPLRDYRGFSSDWHRRRFSVKPGITCLWQINGRNTVGFERWMELDMDYIDQWSVWLDCKILVKTIPAVFRGSGAM